MEHVACMKAKHEGKKPLREFRHSCRDNIKMDHKEMGYDGISLIHLSQNRNTVTNLQVKKQIHNFLTI
jgi:hypothetical protein